METKTEFKLNLADAMLLKDSISHLKEFKNEIEFNATTEGLSCTFMDPANVAMIKFNLLPSACQEYNIKEPLKFCVNIGEFSNILRNATKKDILIMSKDGDKLGLILHSGAIKKEYSLPIIRNEEKEQKVPELNHTAIFNMPMSDLREIIKGASISDYLRITVTKEKVSFYSESDISKFNVDLSKDRIQIMKCDNEIVTSKYSIEYLLKMVNTKKLYENVTVKIANEYPIVLESKTVDYLELLQILAPRVEND